MTKPHIYRFGGQWWVSRNGHDSLRKGITINDVAAGSLRHAMGMAIVRSRWDVQRMQRLGYIRPALAPVDLSRQREAIAAYVCGEEGLVSYPEGREGMSDLDHESINYQFQKARADKAEAERDRYRETLEKAARLLDESVEHEIDVAPAAAPDKRDDALDVILEALEALDGQEPGRGHDA